MMKTGLHYNMTDALYYSLPFFSFSGSKELERSPKHFKYFLENKEDYSSEAKSLGSAVHKLVIEPEDFNNHYRVSDSNSRRGTKAWADELAKSGERRTLKAKEYEELCHIRDSILSYPRAKKLVESSNQKEIAAIWQAHPGKPPIKCKFDLLHERAKIIGDIKTTTDASPEAFASSCMRFGYHQQGALYTKAAEVLGLGDYQFVIIAVESSPPYCSAMYRLSDESKQVGWAHIEKMLEIYYRCVETNEYPGYQTDTTDLHLPAYAYKQAVDKGYL